MNELLLLGVSHKTAPVAVRERLAFSPDQAIEFAAALIAPEAAGQSGARRLAAPGARPARARRGGHGTGGASSEAVVISTCNRTEIYQVSADPVRAEMHALGLLAERAGIRPTELAEATYSPRNCDVARQLFRVTAGLDSMLVGEAEIQGQVRRAFEDAQQAGLTGPLCNRLFNSALTTGRLVRSQTLIGHSRISVASIAVDLASQLLGTLHSRNVIVIGAGETSELTAEALARQGAGTIFVANRRADRARSIAERFDGHVVSFEHLPEHLADADIVLSSTASPHHILGAEELEIVMRDRHDRPLLLIDIAVPRDIDPQCGDLAGVTRYDIDDLQTLAAESISSRVRELPQAEALVENEIRRFARWLGEADILPAVRDLRRHADQLVSAVIAENAGRWQSASPADIERSEAIARAVAKRLLHEPTLRLRNLSGPKRHATIELARELFGLTDVTGTAAGQAAAAAEQEPPATIVELREHKRS